MTFPHVYKQCFVSATKDNARSGFIPYKNEKQYFADVTAFKKIATLFTGWALEFIKIDCCRLWRKGYRLSAIGVILLSPWLCLFDQPLTTVYHTKNLLCTKLINKIM